MTTVQPFVYTSHASRVVFGAGSLAQLGDEIDHLQARRVFVLCTPHQRALAASAGARLGDRVVGLFDRAEMHVPADVARAAQAEAQRLQADCLLAVGGGSTIGLAKAIALMSAVPLPTVAVPTTYAGSEMTPIYGITEGGLKKTGSDAKVLPRTVLYDAELTLGLPVPMSMCSGLNAMAHAAEGLYARNGNPVASLMAEEGVRSLGEALPRLHGAPNDLAARTQAQYGAWLCGTVLGTVGMALHHKLCHTLGGSFGLPHAETHTVVLPHALAYNEGHAPEAMMRIARALGATAAPQAVHDLARRVGAPTSLRELGLAESDLDRATDIAMANAYWNPRPLAREALRALLQRAYDGAPPAP